MLKIYLIGAAVAAVVLGASGYYVHHQIWHAGYDARVAEEKAAAVKAQDTAQKTISTVEENYGPKIEQLRTAPDTGGCVGPLVGSVLDGLPGPH